MTVAVKKNSLFPIAYDEISLVDSGAAGDAHVLIMKRESSSEIEKAKIKPKLRRQVNRIIDQRQAKNKKSKATIGTSAPSAKKGGKKPKSTPCNPKSATGAKETDPKKKSVRAKNFKEEKHPRKANGQMTQTSAESKKKNGKGGTTKAKQDAACRAKKGSVKKTNSAMSSWNTEALLMGAIERKATS